MPNGKFLKNCFQSQGLVKQRGECFALAGSTRQSAVYHCGSLPTLANYLLLFPALEPEEDLATDLAGVGPLITSAIRPSSVCHEFSVRIVISMITSGSTTRDHTWP